MFIRLTQADMRVHAQVLPQRQGDSPREYLQGTRSSKASKSPPQPIFHSPARSSSATSCRLSSRTLNAYLGMRGAPSKAARRARSASSEPIPTARLPSESPWMRMTARSFRSPARRVREPRPGRSPKRKFRGCSGFDPWLECMAALRGRRTRV